MKPWFLLAALALAPSTALAVDGAPLEISGTVQSVELDEIRIERPGLPIAELDIRPDTEVRVDGNPSRPGDLRPGQAVRATFELYGDDPVAVLIDATSAPAPAPTPTP